MSQEKAAALKLLKDAKAQRNAAGHNLKALKARVDETADASSALMRGGSDYQEGGCFPFFSQKRATIPATEETPLSTNTGTPRFCNLF